MKPFARAAALAAAVLASLAFQAGPPPAADRPISRIAFGSCSDQDLPQPIWTPIVAFQPELFLYIGDNIYADTEDMEVMRAKYQRQAALPGLRHLWSIAQVLGTWDDHDLGANDVGAEYTKKAEAQQLFLDFFGVPKDSPRRTQEGVYDARVFGPAGRQVQIILLDTRYFRSPLKPRVPPAPRLGRYVANTDPSSTMLGEAQWAWLERQLAVPAQVRVLVSSIQLVAEDHGYEKWMNFPHERQRLFDLLKKHQSAGAIVISGDRHLAELSMMDAGIGYPLYDLTASALNKSATAWRMYENNRHRVGTMNWGQNFGVITIDWNRADPRISLQIRDEDGDINIQRKLDLSTLQPGVIRERRPGGH
jgi:alkaline phosphatase D